MSAAGTPAQPSPIGDDPQARGRGHPDWAALRQAADAVAANAYAPYSGLRVGAAGLCEDGRVVTGCNVENASYGLTLCAECGLVSAAVAGGGGRLVAVSVTAGDGAPLTPCGRCRQLLAEQGGTELLLDGGPGRPPLTLGEVLPDPFDSSELVSRREPGWGDGAAVGGAAVGGAAVGGRKGGGGKGGGGAGNVVGRGASQ